MGAQSLEPHKKYTIKVIVVVSVDLLNVFYKLHANDECCGKTTSQVILGENSHYVAGG
jgi:hypothetical protein